MKVFEVSRPTILRDYLEVLKIISEEMDFHLTPEGLSVRAMDRSHEEMIEFNLPDAFFDAWKVEEALTLTFSLDEAFKLLKKLSKDDRLTVSLNDEQDKLTFTMRSDITRHKTISLYSDPIDEDPPTPKIYFKSVTRMLLSTFRRVLKDFKDSQHTTFEATPDYITFSTVDDDFKESTPIHRDNDSVLKHRVEDSARAVFQVEDLLKFISKAVKVSEVVNIHLSDDLPIKLDIELPQGSMIYYRAPCQGV